MKKITGAKTRLERHVQKWINEQSLSYDNGAEGVMTDLNYGGCASGMVNHLIYYPDTAKFFATHRREISLIFKVALENQSSSDPASVFGVKWDYSDPLAQEDYNRNLLAWFAFEETARDLALRNGL